MKLVVLGLSLSSSWGNGHATTYRALLRAFARRGHDVLFLERDVAWYAAHRDMPAPDFCRLILYERVQDLACWRDEIAAADAVIVGSYVPDGIAVGDFVAKAARGTLAFYDIDTPVTLAALDRGEEAYIAARQIPRYDVYFSFSGGTSLDLLRRRYGAVMPVALYCSAEIAQDSSGDDSWRWELSYLGTYSADRQPGVDRLLLEVARRAPEKQFAVAGPLYPPDIVWPANVERIEHLPPAEHPGFYRASRFTLNVTRAAMIAAGHSPSVRLFEAAGCATPVISDAWEGLETVLAPGEVIIARSTGDVLAALDLTDAQRNAVGRAGNRRILAEHTTAHRAAELEAVLFAAAVRRSVPLEQGVE